MSAVHRTHPDAVSAACDVRNLITDEVLLRQLRSLKFWANVPDATVDLTLRVQHRTERDSARRFLSDR